MTQLHPIPGRSTTMIHRHTIGTVVLAAAILAFSASAAQAMPQAVRDSQSATITAPVMKSAAITSPVIIAHRYQLSSGLSSVKPSSGQALAQPRISPHDGTQGQIATSNPYKFMSRPSPPTSYRGPVVVTQAQPVAASDSGFNWTAILLGAGIVAALMLLAGAATRHVKPRRAAQF
jgi:hypothetical protein